MATDQDFFGAQLLSQYATSADQPSVSAEIQPPVRPPDMSPWRWITGDQNQQRRATFNEGMGNIPLDLRQLRGGIGDILLSQLGTANTPYGGNLDVNIRGALDQVSQIQGLLQGLSGSGLDPNILSQLMGLSGQGLDPNVTNALTQLMGPGSGLSDIAKTGGAPDITSALDAIRQKGILDIETMAAQQRERFGAYGLGRGSDVEGYVAQGTSRGITDINAAQSSLAAQIMSAAQDRRLSAMGQQAGIAQALGSLQQQNMGLRGQMLSSAGGLQLQDRSNQIGALTGAGQMATSAAGMNLDAQSQNLARRYSEFVRMQQLPPYLQAAMQYATSFPPNKPVVPESGGGLGSSIIGAAGGVLSSILPFMLFSDRNMKYDIEPIGGDINSKLRELPIFTWKYKGTDTKHIGPMAQDFQKTFGVGDGRTIHPVDVLGVLLASQKSLAESLVSRG